ncbi:MAG: hypothetical protein HYW23_04025 [Candidatus Aenigmarchaeota archaeon]|nr:hypothetical protein [Candidatus Aenigmarchaeota archaeon]
MSQKGEQKIWDEFVWIIAAGVLFILILTMVFTSSSSSPIIDQKALSLTLARGDSYTFNVNIKSSDGGKISNVSITSVGELSNWLSFDKTNFDVDNSTALKVKIQVPTTASLRTYAGIITVKSAGGSSSFSLSVNVANVSSIQLTSRPISLGDVEVRYSKGSETLFSKENIQVVSGTFSYSSESFSIAFPPEKVSITNTAHLDLYVVDTNKMGNLVVEVNGQEVYNKKTDVGKVVVPLDKSLLNTTNVVTIRTTGTSIFQFWTNAFYKIEKADFVIDYKDTSQRERTFQLSQNEVLGFRYFQLQSLVKEYSSPLQEMFIKINNQVVYTDRPPLAAINQTLGKDIFGNNIAVGTNNTISFSFEKDSFIKLGDVILVVYSS